MARMPTMSETNTSSNTHPARDSEGSPLSRSGGDEADRGEDGDSRNPCHAAAVPVGCIFWGFMFSSAVLAANSAPILSDDGVILRQRMGHGQIV